MKKVISFDLDDTLAITKSPISDRMAAALGRLLEKYEVCVITGGTFEQIRKQVIDRLTVAPELLEKFHAMPTCGTRYYRYQDGQWQLQYQEDLTEEEKVRISQAIEVSAKELGLWHDNPAGAIIEDRLSQVTYSALGQQATPSDKYAWAKANKERRVRLTEAVQVLLPDFTVRTAGTTSLDVTKPGVDKAYGMQRLMEATGFTKEEILFFGDKLSPDGNDYPVKALGIDCIAVERWEDTAYALEGINAVS